LRSGWGRDGHGGLGLHGAMFTDALFSVKRIVRRATIRLSNEWLQQ
jgi:hypothetical protein